MHSNNLFCNSQSQTHLVRFHRFVAYKMIPLSLYGLNQTGCSFVRLYSMAPGSVHNNLLDKALMPDVLHR